MDNLISQNGLRPVTPIKIHKSFIHEDKLTYSLVALVMFYVR
jgi:hypothetical protein